MTPREENMRWWRKNGAAFDKLLKAFLDASLTNDEFKASCAEFEEGCEKLGMGKINKNFRPFGVDIS